MVLSFTELVYSPKQPTFWHKALHKVQKFVFSANHILCFQFWFVDNLKKVAPYEVYTPEENPFRDWTTEEIQRMLIAPVKEKKAKEEDIIFEIFFLGELTE